MFSLLNYQHVSRKQPFITVALTGVTLSKFTPIGDGLTKLVVSRVGKEYEILVLGLLEQVSTKFTFAATEALLNMAEGRYQYKMYYKGNYIGTKQFVLDKPSVEMNSV